MLNFLSYATFFNSLNKEQILLVESDLKKLIQRNKVSLNNRNKQEQLERKELERKDF